MITEQFGQFFLADLISKLNQTRTDSKKIKSTGKALVATSADKAVGLISYTTEVDYKILSNAFELDIYDNFLKEDLMDAIRAKREDIKRKEMWKQELDRRKKLQRIYEETMECKWIGQRLCLQINLINKATTIFSEMEPFRFVNNDTTSKTLTREMVEKMIDRWLNEKAPPFKFNQPSKLFLETSWKESFDVYSIIQPASQFFLETLVFFGLPKKYMEGEGHWKEWEKKKIEEKNTANVKKPMMNRGKKDTKKGKKKDYKPEWTIPTTFDITPLYNAFKKFVSVKPEERSKFIQDLEGNKNKVISFFTNEMGELIDSRCGDLNSLGDSLIKVGVPISHEIIENLSPMLECFGDVIPQEEIKIEMPQTQKEEEKKEISSIKNKFSPGNALKRILEMSEPPKPIEVIKKWVSYLEFMKGITTIKTYDILMCKLGYFSCEILQTIVQFNNEEEQAKIAKEEKELIKPLPPTKFDSIIASMTDDSSLPEVPDEYHNAISINLFCIDSNFESRSEDFLKYGFKLFPDRDYIILTQPHTIPESTLLSHFLQVPKKLNSNIDHVLYIMHRDFYSDKGPYLRRSALDDFMQMKPYIETLNSSKLIQDDLSEAIKDVSSKKVAFSALCGKTVRIFEAFC